MEKIKINDKIFDGTMKKLSKNHVQLVFVDGKKPKEAALKNGFCLVDCKERVYCNCSDYVTVYKEIQDGYVLSNDQSIYTEPEPIPVVEPSEEELAERERQQQMMEKQNEIDALKAQLASTDYKFSKMYEYSLVDKPLEYDVNALHIERQALRDQINELEREVEILSQ